MGHPTTPFRAAGLVLLALAVLFLMTGGSPAFGEEEKGKEEKGKEEKPEKPEKKEGLVPVVATVNGALITKFDIDHEMGYVADMLRVPKKEREKQLLELRELKTRDLVTVEILIQAAKRKGIKIPDSMIREEIRLQAKDKGGMGNYHKLLAKKGMTYAENWNRVKRALYVRELERRLYRSRTRTRFVYPRFREIAVTPHQIREYYDRNPKEFEGEEPGQFRILWLRIEDFGSRKETRSRIEALRERIVSAEDPEVRAERFGELAREFSNGDAAKKGGVMVLTHEPALSPELHKALLRLRPGEVSATISTDFGFFLLFLERPISKRMRPFDKVQKEIRDRLLNQNLRARVAAEEERLKNSARIWPGEIENLVKKDLRR